MGGARAESEPSSNKEMQPRAFDKISKKGKVITESELQLEKE